MCTKLTDIEEIIEFYNQVCFLTERIGAADKH